MLAYQQASFFHERKVKNTKKVLSIAGSDCSGGAGIQADLKTFVAYGVYGMSVITSVVAENTSRVIRSQNITPEIIDDQMEAVFEDICPDAVKVGMLPQAASMEAVARKLREYQPRNIVVDPVMIAKGGGSLMEPDAVDTLIREILPLADLLTPNIPEACRISGLPIDTPADQKRVAEKIAGLGARAVLVKGGHGSGDAEDILFDGLQFHSFSTGRIPTKNTHGTGCTLSSAIAANLAMGLDLREAVAQAKDYVTTAILHALPLGNGCGPTNHFYDLYRNGLQRGADSDER